MIKPDRLLFIAFYWILFPVENQAQFAVVPPPADTLPSGVISSSGYFPEDHLPVIGAWFWQKEAFKPGGYKYFIDIVRDHSCYNWLTTAVKAPGKTIADFDVHNQIKQAVVYANKHGIKMSLWLDPRLLRWKFKEMYPDELQESLWLNEVALSEKKPVEAVVKSIALGDHMTHGQTDFIPLEGSLVRVYSYHKTTHGIDPRTLEDITDKCTVKIACKDSVVVSIPGIGEPGSMKACVMVSFIRLTPDVFAPHLIEFQNKIIEDYADVPLSGAEYPEWGFPPSYPVMNTKSLGHFWYSKHYAEAYAKKTGGRDLLADCLLMYIGVNGEERNRLMAINNYMALNRQRNTDLEDDFYRATKKTFGQGSTVINHPTWWPYPNQLEFRKNGLHWWAATRDLAQTDETTPFAVRTALAKKWNSRVWYNQYYATTEKDYQIALWSSVLGGGRVDFHPYYPNTGRNERLNERLGGALELLRGDLMRGESRVRLLDFISKSPLDCPVAVIFGHTAAMNWAAPYFEDVGMGIADSLWRMGIPTDLIPTSEIGNKSLYIDKDGWVCYGKQRYAAVILYNPEFEGSLTADFFNEAAKGKTALFRVGNWTKDFNGQFYNGNPALPRTMAPGDIKSITSGIRGILKKHGIPLQSPATQTLGGFATSSNAPSATGFCRLIDGTLIQVAGSNDMAGDRINSKMKIGKHEVVFDAVGVAAVKLDESGRLLALAAGGLQYFKAGKMTIRLDERTDLSLWMTDNGAYKGVVQGMEGEIPQQLLNITGNWTRISIPTPLTWDHRSVSIGK